MASEGFKRKLTSIFSADAAGFCRLMGDNETATFRTIPEYRSVISTIAGRGKTTAWKIVRPILG